MAKKSAAARQANASRRLAAAAKEQGVTLVRAPGAAPSTPPSKPSAGKPNANNAPKARPAAPASKPARAAAPSAPARANTMPKPTAPLVPAKAAPKPAPTPAPRPAPTPMPPARSPRLSRATRGRGAALVTPEHYAYVLRDLRLTGALALIMFLVIIGLYFYLHSIGQA